MSDALITELLWKNPEKKRVSFDISMCWTLQNNGHKCFKKVSSITVQTYIKVDIVSFRFICRTWQISRWQHIRNQDLWCMHDNTRRGLPQNRYVSLPNNFFSLWHNCDIGTDFKVSTATGFLNQELPDWFLLYSPDGAVSGPSIIWWSLHPLLLVLD